MNTRTALLLSAAGAAALCAAPRSSTNYSIAAEIADAGGGRSSSASYEHHGSFHSMNGASTAGADFTLLHGYLGQLDDDTVPAAFLAWQTTHFGDPGAPAAAPLADPDEDGLDNVAEYAWDLDPNIPARTAFDPATNTTGLPVITTDPAGDMTIVMPRRIDGSVACVLESATDLTDWQPAPVTPSPPVAINAAWERVTLVLTGATAGPRAQFRIVATLR